MNKPLKFKLLAFFHDTDTNTDIEYSDEIDIKCENHVEFAKFLEKIHNEGHFKPLNRHYGHHSLTTDVKNKYVITEELAIYTPIVKKDFDMLFKKWKAILKQEHLV